MTDLFHWAKPVDDQEMAQLESLLQAALMPVPPRGSYQKDLRNRLEKSDAPAIELHSTRPYSVLLWVMAGLAFVMLLLVVGIKSFIALGGWGAVSVLRRRLDTDG